MTPSPHSDHDRLLELLAEQALVGLDADEQHELESLLQAHPDFDAECLDRTAALLDRAVAAGDTEPLPQPLQDRIRAQGSRLGLQTRPSIEADRGAGDGSGDHTYENATCWKHERSQSRRTENECTGARWSLGWPPPRACWWPCSSWYTRPTPAPPPKSPAVANSEPPATPPGTDTPAPSTATLTVAQQREQLLASAPDVLHLQLVNSDSGAVARKPGGDIVWSNGRQMGYLRLQGLANDAPPQRQYQLWIIGGDASSNEFINGGMFFVDRNTGELIRAHSRGPFRATAEDVSRQRGTAGRRRGLDPLAAG
jgi:hypothetical protein